ncbi:MAG: hypothetical protein R2747_06165 [Pyrinomonadaceae bacterium]
MKTIVRADFAKALEVLLMETFESAPLAEGGVYLDREIGMFSTLEKISATDASLSINDTSIAAHTEHARFYLDILNKYLHSKAEFVNWNNSWRVKTVDEDEWEDLKLRLAENYREVCESVEKNENWDVNLITVALGMITHSAYHLGAIRQMIKQI